MHLRLACHRDAGVSVRAELDLRVFERESDATVWLLRESAARREIGILPRLLLNYLPSDVLPFP